MTGTVAPLKSETTPTHAVWSEALDAVRLKRAKAAFSTRRVTFPGEEQLLCGERQPQAGDLLLARVTRLGQHSRIELATGRRARLHIGDEIVVCYGNRYAPDQFEALLPEDLGPCQLVAAGGIASRMRCKHGSMKPPTRIEPAGLIGDSEGRVLNVADAALVPRTVTRCPPVIAVVGSAMNAGKTSTAAHLIKGLDHAGLRVGGCKVTGTGAGGDVWFMRDSGAAQVFDFTDAGHASTYRLPIDEIAAITETLIAHLADEAVDVIVMEVADGLFQEETAALLESATFRNRVNGVIFAAADALGVVAGMAWLAQRRLPVIALSGQVTASPLASREAREAVGREALSLEQLADPVAAHGLLAQLTSTAVIAEAS